MKRNTIIKLVVLNLSLIIINIFCFSEGLLNLGFSLDNPLKTALSCTVLFASLIGLIYGNYTILTYSGIENINNSNNSTEAFDYIKMLQRYSKVNYYKRETKILKDQVERFYRKKDKFENILFEKFKTDEENKNIFLNVFEEGENILLKNTKNCINIISLFDEEEYNEYLKYNTSSEKGRIYEDNYNDVCNGVQLNENILLNIDKLMIETTKFGDSVEQTSLDKKSIQKLEDITNSMKTMRTSENF